jgi:response regulator RpfG family c-di-GMP phosphodiesterase
MIHADSATFQPCEKRLSRESNFLEWLINDSLVLAEDWEALPQKVHQEYLECDDHESALTLLVEHRLLTEYQADRIRAGTTYGLVLGNYRVLDRLGAGGMAVVFKAEHVEMRRIVAIKVLPFTQELHWKMLRRFIVEMRTVAQLQHPNIVAGFDAGRTTPADPDSPILHYIVMEYVPGKTLEEHVETHGPLDPAHACDLIHQIASALVEANKLNLVHRDIKPSNILLTPDGQAKLLDFGLVHQRGNQLTEAGTVLGTMDFMAPEQSQDASKVDIRADLYGLGGTLYWCLTGRTPFAAQQTMYETLMKRLTQAPPSVRASRPDISPALDAVVARLMAVNPEDRFAKPQELMRALLGFLRPDSFGESVSISAQRGNALSATPSSSENGAGKIHRILVVDDEASIRSFCKTVLKTDAVHVEEIADGHIALELVKQNAYDLLLLDNHMPEMTGTELLKRIRELPLDPHLKIVMISGHTSPDEMARMLLAGADDYLTKPFSVVQLNSRIKTALRLKDAQDQSDLLKRHLLSVNAEMERNLTARDSDLVSARNALVLTLAKLVAQRDTEPVAHIIRIQRYCRHLAEEASRLPNFAAQIDAAFLEMIECCAPLHDIGKVALPDYILMKPGKLTDEERILMQAHTTIGADTLETVTKQHGFALAFWQMAIEIVRHHHERYDGAGYPSGLSGNDIPLAARIVAIADVYDALRSRRSYKPALSHAVAMQLMTETTVGQFDPFLLQAFVKCADHFEKAFHESPD